MTNSALKTPQILELSGIGDRSVLEPLGIENKIYLPGVGENLQEHYLAAVAFGEFKLLFIEGLFS